jgi:hypothetical protein
MYIRNEGELSPDENGGGSFFIFDLSRGRKDWFVLLTYALI